MIQRTCIGGCDTYAKQAVFDLESKLKAIDQKLMTTVTTPIPGVDRPKLDVSPELDVIRANYYQWLIGVPATPSKVKGQQVKGHGSWVIGHRS